MDVSAQDILRVKKRHLQSLKVGDSSKLPASHSDTFWISKEQVYSKIGLNECFALLNPTSKYVDPTLGKQVGLKPGSNFSMRGFVNYEYRYISSIDTPLAQNNVQQHTVRAQLMLDFKIPVVLNVLYSRSNSNYYPDHFDLGFTYNQVDFKRKLVDQYQQLITQNLNHSLGLDSLNNLNNQLSQSIGQWAQLESKNSYQFFKQKAKDELVGIIIDTLKKTFSGIDEADFRKSFEDYVLRNKSIENYATNCDSLTQSRLDAVLANYHQELDAIKEVEQRLGQLEEQLSEVDGKIRNIKKQISDSVMLIKNLASKGTGTDAANFFWDKMKENGLINEKQLMLLKKVNKLSVGQSFVSYSPLTVTDFSFSGVALEAGGKKLFSFAAGVSNNRMRNFMFSNEKRPQQPFVAVKMAVIENRNVGLDFVAYAGSRTMMEQNVIATHKVPISGYSVILRFKGFKNQLLESEFAKSSMSQIRMPDSTGRKTSGWLNFKDHSNEAYRISYSGNFQKMGTTIKGNFKQQGMFFQSLGVYNYSALGRSFDFMVDQRLFKRSLRIRIGAKKNDFTNQFVENLSSNTTFYTAQLLYTKTKWPTISLGYFPVSQVVLLNGREEFGEITYHTLHGGLNYTFTVGKTRHSANIQYALMDGDAIDSNFSRVSNSSFSTNYFSQIGKWILSAGYVVNKAPLFEHSIYDVSVGFSFKRNGLFSLKGKVGNPGDGQNMFGGAVNIHFPEWRWGSLQIMADRQLLPVFRSQALRPVNSGRIIFIKKIV